MNRKHENDPERDRSSRAERPTEMGREPDDLLNPDESDLARAQREGNLGNERTRDPGPDSTRRDRNG